MKKIIWINIENAGLNNYKDKILEIATVITDINFNVLDIGPFLAIYQNKNTINLMNKWKKYIHNYNGLLDLVKNSKINEKEACNLTLFYIKKWIKNNKYIILLNDINIKIIYNYMPQLNKKKILYISKLRQFIKFINNKKNKYNNYNTYKAPSNILNNIKEFKKYKYFLFKKNG